MATKIVMCKQIISLYNLSYLNYKQLYKKNSNQYIDLMHEYVLFFRYLINEISCRPLYQITCHENSSSITRTDIMKQIKMNGKCYVIFSLYILVFYRQLIILSHTTFIKRFGNLICDLLKLLSDKFSGRKISQKLIKLLYLYQITF